MSKNIFLKIEVPFDSIEYVCTRISDMIDGYYPHLDLGINTQDLLNRPGFVDKIIENFQTELNRHACLDADHDGSLVDGIIESNDFDFDTEFAQEIASAKKEYELLLD